MDIIRGHSNASDPNDAFLEAIEDFNKDTTLIFFLSDGKRFPEFARRFNETFPDATTLGASTFASFTNEGIAEVGLVAFAFSGNFHITSGLIREISRHPSTIYSDLVRQSFSKIAPFVSRRDQICCLLLNPAGTASEEAVIDTIGAALKGESVPVFGGSASSEVCASAKVAYNGQTYSNASVFLFLALETEHFVIVKENVFAPFGPIHTVTKANLSHRALVELDGKKAVSVIASDLKISEAEVPAALKSHPFGRNLIGDLQINEFERVSPEGDIVGYCRFYEGSQVGLLSLKDPQKTQEETFKLLHSKMEKPLWTIAVNCYSRTQLYLKNNWMDSFTHSMGENLGDYIAFTSHGEQLGAYQLNLTLLLLSIGR